MTYLLSNSRVEWRGPGCDIWLGLNKEDPNLNSVIDGINDGPLTLWDDANRQSYKDGITRFQNQISNLKTAAGVSAVNYWPLVDCFSHIIRVLSEEGNSEAITFEKTGNAIATVLGISHSSFGDKLEKMKNVKGRKLDTDLTTTDLKELVKEYKGVYLSAKGENFPSVPKKEP